MGGDGTGKGSRVSRDFGAAVALHRRRLEQQRRWQQEQQEQLEEALLGQNATLGLVQSVQASQEQFLADLRNRSQHVERLVGKQSENLGLVVHNQTLQQVGLQAQQHQLEEMRALQAQLEERIKPVLKLQR